MKVGWFTRYMSSIRRLNLLYKRHSKLQVEHIKLLKDIGKIREDCPNCWIKAVGLIIESEELKRK